MNITSLPHNRLPAGVVSVVGLLYVFIAVAQSQESDEVFELSPFTVDAADSNGYQATSTLAGNRIKTNLKDLGASITVITEEFLDDVAATDAQTLLSYVSNAEVGGNQGNFSGATDVGFGRFYQTDARTNPQSNTRLRGLLGADLTRGFFLTDTPFDSYNTERVTVSRGPNSILFGIGSPGGVINNAPKRAIHNADFGELGIRIDNYNSLRATFDYNKSIIEDRLALRVALLEETQKYKQKPAHEDQTRFYAALDGILLNGDRSQTSIRMNFEDGKQDGSPVEIIPPTVAYNGWFEPLRRSDIEPYTGNVPDSTHLDPADGGTWQFQATFDDPIGINNNENLMFTSVRPLHFRHVGIFYSERGLTAPNVGGGLGLGGYNGLIPWTASRDTIASAGLVGTPMAEGYAPDTPLGQIPSYRVTSPLGDSYAIGFSPPTLQNREVFDFYNHVYSNGLDVIEREFENFNVALEQTFLEGKLGFELAYDEQTYNTYQDFLFTGGNGTNLAGPYDIFVDISKFITNGQLNPNYGRAATWVRQPKQRDDTTDRETFRATAFAEFDLTENDGWLKHFGRHRVTGLYSDYTKDFFNVTTGDNSDSDEFNMDSAQAHEVGRANGRRSINIIAYTSEDNLFGLQSKNDVRLHPIDFKRYKLGDRFNYAWVDTTGPNQALNGGVAGDRMIHTNEVEIVRNQIGGAINQTTIEAKAIVWQSYFLDEHIVALYGYREDDTENFAINSVAEASVPQFLTDFSWNPEFTKLSSTPQPKVEGQPNDTQTWSVVGRLPDGWLGSLPFNLQAHWAQAENFNPVGVRSNALGRPIFEPSGLTEEYGFTISTNDNKYSVKFNWYETELSNINAGVTNNVAGTVIGRINAHRAAELDGIEFSRHLDLLPSGNPGSFPIQNYDQYYTAALGTLPQELIDSVQPVQLDTNSDGIWDQYVMNNPIQNLQGTRSQIAEGMEIELVANPTKNWRIAANVSQQETKFDNTAPLLLQTINHYVSAARAAGLGDLQEDPAFERDAEFYEVTLGLLSAPILTERAKDGRVSQEQREWRITGVSNYEFQEGAFKGFGIGGAVRWEDEAATGYLTFYDSTLDAVLPDVNTPYFDDGLFSGDAWISYKRPIMDGKVNWHAQLNIRNLVGENGNIPVATNPDGQVAVIRIPNPRTIYFTNTFSF